jgi:hypothetical protein
MAKARMAAQLAATIPARVGLLADVSESLHASGVNITALSAYERDGIGRFLMVTSNNAEAAKALSRLNADYVEKPVLAVELANEPGALEDAARTLAEAGVNVEYCYGTVSGTTAVVVFHTSDDTKALSLF